MSSVIRIDELSRMIRAKRGRQGLRATADEIGEISASTLSRIEQGKLPDLDTFIRICNWLGVVADRFTNENAKHEVVFNQTRQVVAAHLRADRTLDPQTAEALVKMIDMAYDALDHGQIGGRKVKNAPRVQDLG